MEQVNHPTHYNREGRKECIVEMRERFGDVATGIFCLLNAFKYDYRAGEKGDAAIDHQKSDWYNQYAKMLQEWITNDKSTAYHDLNTLMLPQLGLEYIEGETDNA